MKWYAYITFFRSYEFMNNTQGSIINNEETIDLRRIFKAILRKLWAVALAAVVFAAATFLGTFYLVKPQYRASALFYVNSDTLSVGSINVGSLSAAKSLVDSYIVILKSRESLNAVIDYAELDYTYGQLNGMVSASAVNNTEIFRVNVVSNNPAEAEKIANAIAYILPKRISGIIEGTTAKIVDYAVAPSAPFAPNYTKNTLMGALAGILISLAFIVITDITDITIRTGDDFSQITSLPVLAAIPDMSGTSVKNAYYHKGSKTKRKKGALPVSEQMHIGSRISFAATEANKLLRTKLLFSFADEKTNHVIGISSSMTGEGKTITSINLAYSLAQLKKSVLLLDCDLRRPSIHKKLSINKTPGLSEYLTGQHNKSDIIKSYSFKDSESSFDVITSGENPPNPTELLSSERMLNMLESLKEKYEYIIIDLPPVGEVGDALAVAEYVDGMLMVVRQNYCNRWALNDAISQFEFVNSRLIGIVLNCSNDDIEGYGRYKYARYGRYRRYYKYRQYGYGTYRRAYLNAMKKNKEQQEQSVKNNENSNS